MNRFLSCPQWTRRQTLWFIAGTVTSVGLSACNQATTVTSNSATADSTAAAFGITNWIGNTTLYIAQEKGFFQEGGLNLTLNTFATVSEGFPALTAGRLQGAAPVTSEAVSLASEALDYRIVAVMDTSAGADAFVARNPIKSIADFKGKQVAVRRGDLGHFFLLQVLAEAGLTEKDITIVDTTPDAAAAAYISGDIDIAYTYSPYLEEANAAQTDGRTIYDSSMMPTAIADLFIFSNQFIQEHPQAIQAFVSGVFKALDFLQTNPEEALAIAAKPLGVTPEELGTQLKGIKLVDLQTNIEMLSNPQSDLYFGRQMTAMAEFLKSQNQIQTIPDLSKFIDPQFILALSNNA